MKVLRLIGQAAVTAAMVVVLIVFWDAIAAHLATFFGFANGSGNGSHYLFFSGSGSDFGELAIISGGVILYRRLNCKRSWCPFMGMHDFTDPTDGVSRKLCWYHHPDVMHKTLKASHIRRIQRHRLAERSDGEQATGGTVPPDTGPHEGTIERGAEGAE